MVSENHFLILVLLIIFTIASAEDDVLVPFGGNQKFLATTFDRDAIETSVNEHSTSSATSDEIKKLRTFNLQRSVLDTPQSEWMSTTTGPSHQLDDQPSELKHEQTGEKPPTKDDDFVLVFSHAIEIPLARTPQSVIESNGVSSSVRQSSFTSDTQEEESNQKPLKQDVNSLKSHQMAQEKKYQEVPVIFQRIQESSYEPDPYVAKASPSQPLVRMYSYLAPVASASKEHGDYQHYIPSSSYRPEQVKNNSPVYEKPQKFRVEQPQKYQMDKPQKYESEQPRERPVEQKSVKKFNEIPTGYSTGIQKFIPLSYRAPIMPFFHSMTRHGMPQQPLIQNPQSSQNVPQFFPSDLNQITPESHGVPIASPSSPFRSLSNIPLFPRLFQLHQLLGGRRWL